MPYPPEKGDSLSEFMKRCMRLMEAEGKSARKAQEICYAVWLENKGLKKKRN